MPDSLKAVEGGFIPAAPAGPEDYDAATRAVQEHIDHRAVRTVADGRSERTRSGYPQEWASWTKFCNESGVPLLAVTPGAMVMFVEWLWTRAGSKTGTFTAPSTIDPRISAGVSTSSCPGPRARARTRNGAPAAAVEAAARPPTSSRPKHGGWR
ncbi:hypothetical protein [Streptomyces sp. GQFP]|uniref:hypothetical protein n=1 Tax=Streptomyces sp. GQFP TaxID=2907545 RepID=UPI001F3D9213|nr:hypothetical protein [Streptomyces sp. GQFP]UIX33854.1 hypothetical protein LUX31_29785 [Streptomyces sp. GQFP]